MVKHRLLVLQCDLLRAHIIVCAFLNVFVSFALYLIDEMKCINSITEGIDIDSWLVKPLEAGST